MNTNKIRDAAKLLIAALDEKEEVIITLDLTAAEVGALQAICRCGCSVPAAVMRADLPHCSTAREMSAVLTKIRLTLPC